jgi:hypothetical protein
MTWALVWHDLHTDAEVYVFDTDGEAHKAAVKMMIDYLRSYVNWTDRVARAAYLERALAVNSASMVHDWMVSELNNALDSDLENLYWHVTEVRC